MQPQLAVVPYRRYAPLTIRFVPHSQTQFHVAWPPFVLPALEITVHRPNLIPVRSFTLLILTAFRKRLEVDRGEGGKAYRFSGATLSPQITYSVVPQFSDPLNVHLDSMRTMNCSTRRSAVLMAFQPQEALWFSGSAVPAEPSCLTMCCRPPPSTSVTP